MAAKWEIKPEFFKRALKATRDVSEEIDGLEDRWNDCTERWQDSDRGQAILEWIEEARSHIEATIEGLEELQDLEAP
ncbi:hypothetical protein [Mycobacteroides abscessus]|uniref:hypothetical protein n=1 Tax=Mycobacteroides abscessus TaxID=36809 RepID=UPI0009A5AC16|nr:hypothetical protein [Mycobacteroides abscessus]SLH39362.1 Uncharacterised protein [Mycobacteroides abscessus subsp. massiliense]